MAVRYAIYHCPEADSDLYRAASDWLGYDAVSGWEIVPDLPADIAEAEWRAATDAPRTYGFHATLKPPFRLAAGRTEGELRGALSDFARTYGAASLRSLAVAEIGGFLALLPEDDIAPLAALAGACVAEFDGFRAPPEPGEAEKRQAGGLTPRQEEYLGRWGYPYVFEEFRFHMTLTGRLDDATRARFRTALEARLSGPAAAAQTIGSLCLFVQPSREARFEFRERFPLLG
jgi:putative phosphonate metabolism protein